MLQVAELVRLLPGRSSTSARPTRGEGPVAQKGLAGPEVPRNLGRWPAAWRYRGHTPAELLGGGMKSRPTSSRGRPRRQHTRLSGEHAAVPTGPSQLEVSTPRWRPTPR